MEIHEQTGPILLLAGPGTGKTYRLAQRIKYLTDQKSIDRDNITVITFTAASARNMHERISDSTRIETYTPPKKQPRLICTMHSLGFKIIAENPHYFGYKDPIQILNSDETRKAIIEDAAQLLGLKRNEAQITIKCRQNGDCKPVNETKCKICEKYRQILKVCSTIDYDDQIFLANEILNNDGAVLQKYKSKCNHLLIDEYQDINTAQFELISLLIGGQEGGLFAVGDDDQSIYSFRGGSPRFIREFKKYFGKDAKIFPLLKSYRCPKFILESSIELVESYDPERLEKGSFQYDNILTGKIKIHNVASDQKEAAQVKSIINRSLPSKKVLILIPGRRFGDLLIELLKHSNISFVAPRNVPGEGLPVIKILSLWINNINNNIALRQLFSVLIENKDFGVPSKKSRKNDLLDQREKALEAISFLWDDLLSGNVQNLWNSLKLNHELDELLKNILLSLEKALELYNQQNVENFIGHITSTFRLWKDNQALLEEVESWIDVTNYFFNQTNEPGVEIMTLQGAKGLEADVVCIVGMEDGVLPKNPNDDSKIPEESRLMLVSLTRAKEELHIFHARKRSGAVMYTKTFQKGKPTYKRSSFINKIPKDYIEIVYHP